MATLQEATRIAKDRKAFRIWLMQPDAWKNNKEMEEEEQGEVVVFFYISFYCTTSLIIIDYKYT